MATAASLIAVAQMDEESMKILLKYDWPGNIRELQNVCERLQILADGHTIMP